MSMESTEEKQTTLGAEVSALLKEVRSRSRKLTRARKLLQAVDGREPEAGDYEAWLELHQGLDDKPLGVADLDERREALVGRLGEIMQRLGVKARMKFLMKLDMLAGKEELEVERVSEAPLVLYLKPLTVEIDFDGGGATLLFGHEKIQDVAIDAGAIIEARRRALSAMKERALGSEEFFVQLLKAYRMALALKGAEFGERIDLVDVLVPLSVVIAEPRDLRRKNTAALSPIPRHLLAWQLSKLRRDGLLEHGGKRLDIGAATGGSTRDKNDVLFIPIGATGGQYYGSLRFENLTTGKA